MATTAIIPVIYSFFKRTCFPDWSIALQTHEHALLTFVLQGSALYEIDGQTYAPHAGEMCYIPAGTPYRAEVVAGDLMTCYTVAFQVFTQEGQTYALPFSPLNSIGISGDILDLFEQLDRIWLQREALYELQAQALLTLILHHTIAKLQHPQAYCNLEPRIRQAVDYILAHFTEPITVHGLAKTIGLNPVYFGTLFRDETGLSLKDYLNQVRTNRAENLLASGEFLVHQIATLCGFSDTFYFSKVYKRIKGVCPSKDQYMQA